MLSGRSLLASAIALALLPLPLLAQNAQQIDDTPPSSLDRLAVIGSPEQALEIAGSAHYLDDEQLAEFGYSDVHRVLRSVPGVYVIDEEGLGLRPNIGIRGSGTDRSSRITLLEDGVLIAPAPYAAPAAYYFPTMARMHAVEIRKGSSAIKTGPRTTGGAINFVTTPIPTQLSGVADVAYGSDNTLLGYGHVGASNERAGFMLETVQQDSDGFKNLDGGGDTGYRLEDFLGKLRFNSAPGARYYQEVELRFGRTEHDGDETYLGLTDADFDATPNRRYAGSQLDNIITEHDQYQIRHRIDFGPDVDLTTVAYRNEFARNWYKLGSVNGRSIASVLADPATFADEVAWLTGEDSPDDALLLRNNNREYLSEGVQTVLGWVTRTGAVDHNLELSLRLHQDEEDRFQDDDRYRMENGRLVLTTDGAPGTQTNRVGEAEAVSFYIQDEIRIGQWAITPGLRYENIDLTRTDFPKSADGRAQGPTQVRRNSVSEVLPGLGVAWFMGDTTSLFASVHKGFNPPGPGSSADPEESVNSEFGMRYHSGRVHAEVIGFYNDYSNLVGTCTASTGGDCDFGDQFDGGEATVRGLEASLGTDLSLFQDWQISVPVKLAYTWTEAEFDSSFASSFGEWGAVEKGDSLPYLPEHIFYAGVGLEGERWRVNLGSNYVDDMRTIASQGPIDASLRTESAWIFDLAAGYRLNNYTELNARVENLTDEAYIASRRPAGARPGRDRAGFLELRFAF